VVSSNSKFPTKLLVESRVILLSSWLSSPGAVVVVGVVVGGVVVCVVVGVVVGVLAACVVVIVGVVVGHVVDRVLAHHVISHGLTDSHYMLNSILSVMLNDARRLID